MAAILIVGLITAFMLPLELFPSVELESVTVSTLYPGTSAEDVEKLVSIPIEDDISDISGVKVVRSLSTEGRSVVTAEIEPGENLDDLTEEIRSEVAKGKGELPTDAEDPVVRAVKPRFQVINISIAGDVKRDELRAYAKRLEDELKVVDGVESVTASGLGDPVFWVRADPYKMRQYDVTIEQVASAIQKKNLDLPGGVFEQGRVEFLVRTSGRVEKPLDLLNLPVRRSPDGFHVLLRDIATVELGEEKTLSTSRVNGLPAISFWVNKQEKADVLDTVEMIRDRVESFKKTIPEEIKVFATNDNSHWVRDRLKTMIKNGLIGLAFVLIVLAAFLDLRAASMAALGIPVSFFGAFILMDLSGITLNLLSMFGLILVLGIIVDDAIIVSENIQRYIQMGLPPKAAAVKGTNEVALPVIATILTNIAAFLPLLLTTGLIGKFVVVIPVVAIFALLVSMLEALVILPSHCADFLKPIRAVRGNRGWVRRVRSSYLRALYFVIRKRYVAVGSFMAILILVGVIFKQMPLTLFYSRDISTFMIRVENPSWSTLGDTVNSVAQVEDVIRSTIPAHALKNTVSMIGLDLSKRSVRFGDHLATIVVEFEDFDKRSENGITMMKEVRRKAKELVVGPVTLDFIKTGGPPKGKPVDVRIQGNNFDSLKEVAGELEKYVETLPGVFGVADDMVWGKPEVRIEVDERRAALYGLDTRTVARAVRASVDGLTVATTRLGSEEADIVLIYDLPEGNIMNLLEGYKIGTPRGGWVPLGAVARIEVEPSLLSISRYDMERSIAVTSEIDEGATTVSEVSVKIKGFLNALLKSYPGYKFEFGGEEEETRDSLHSILRAAVIAIIVIYMILATVLKSYIQPLLIMSVLPFGLVGVVIGLLIRGDPITFPALIGVVALLGIMVNDSLLLMDFINNRRPTMGTVMAVGLSCKHRFRPIVLTTVTTFGGLASLMVQTRGEAAFLAPMAVSLGFGLMFATLITLFLIPSLYLILEDIRLYLRRAFGR